MNKLINFNDLIEKEGIYFKKNKLSPYTGNVSGSYVGYMKEGLPTGTWEEYHEGVLLSKSTYNNGDLEGLLINYYNNGNIKEKGFVKKNRWEGEYKEYYENGKIRAIKNYLEGKLEGTSTLYYKNGEIKESKFYKNDKLNNEFLYFYNSGQLWIKSNYLNGKLHGDRYIYYNNGTLEKKETYNNGLNITNKVH